MIVNIPKNIDDVQAKISYGLTTRKLVGIAVAVVTFAACFLVFHLNLRICGVLAGTVMGLTVYTHQGVSAPVLIKNLIFSSFAPALYGENLICVKTRSKKEIKKERKAIKAKEKKYRRQHREAGEIASIR